jgi:transposase
MPWMETSVVRERSRFVEDFESGQWSMTELCERFGISRPTGHKWVGRHQAEGQAGLRDRSRSAPAAPVSR